ncbi:MSEP-CTERM sorting domain-containing protein [Aquimarina sp. BL5]|uniref:MSEP-CTERM sorting domain-containing protein n=1 Tax=Aquimarina sp. BL5 TaxID=1714860 RepID=UPI000E52344B|nr:MSEP-CTERM sorting domain-containing protein [Aquimarina sp. BL5]AXT50922.1 MSEP-CTERM sorting domain-containing protein [Aquimarina sp. BL5]
MQNLLNPRWILIINTVPLIILYFLFFGQFTIIHSLLEDVHITHWKTFGSTLFILGFLNLLYAIFLIIKKRKVSIFYAIIALLIYIPFIYLFNEYSDEIIPFSIPRWMVSGNITLYVGTFLMPTIAYSLFIIVIRLTSKNKKHNAWMNFLAAIAVPLCWYLFFQLILPLWQPVESNFSTHAFLIFLISGTLLFLFFVIRGVFILATKKGALWKKYELGWKIPITILFPLLGLALNNGLLSNFNSFDNSSGLFGNFNDPWFYIIAVINGVLICLPNRPNIKYQIFLFIGRNITFAYSLYFFIVFLPFLPLSVIAIIIIGTGFLMLTPLLLFIIHIQELTENFSLLKKHLSANILRIISIASFLVIPICLTTLYKSDQNTLKETLNYIYNPNYSKQYSIDKNSLSKTINTVKQHKEKRNGEIFNGRQTPYLSSFYNWIVLGNLTLSNAKIDVIEHIFYGTPSSELLPEDIRNDKVEISNITSESFFDPSQNAWKSWIHLEIVNNESTNGLKEYATTLKLPTGCWISDYYLYVGDRKEMGLLAEKKAAMWVFSQIRNENKDPGLLYYLTGNKVAFRVFPFTSNETRKTGIEFIHKDPVTLTFDGKEIKLGHTGQLSNNSSVKNNNVIYISSKEKEKLKEVKRTPYYHFLVDASLHKENNIDEFSSRIKKLVTKNNELSKNAKISFVNTYTSSIRYNDNWEKEYKNQSFEGGFYLDRAIKKTLYNSYHNDTDSYPILVIVTDSIKNSVLDKDFSDFKITSPENNEFYNLSKEGMLQPHSLLTNPKKQITDTIENKFDKTVLKYIDDDDTIAYLPNDKKSSIILKKGPYKATESQILEKNWNQALSMHGMWISQTLFPESSKKEWLNLVKHSFISKVMSPVTSYLVVENEAQKAILKKKQEQILSGNKDLDIGEDTPRMSEPNILILLLLLISILFYRNKQKNKNAG